MSRTSSLRFLNIDLEATGVDPVHDRILEVAVIGTDENLNELFTYQSIVRLNYEAVERLALNEFVTAMHTKNGLLDELAAAGDTAPTLDMVEADILNLIDAYRGEDHDLSFAGSGVERFDNLIITEQMPALRSQVTTYWALDTSTATREYKTVTGRQIVPVNPDKSHRALDDIREDLARARAFRELYRTAPYQQSTEHPLDRTLSALALVDAYANQNVVSKDDYDLYDTEKAGSVTALLQTTAPTDVIFGLLDVAASLLARLANVQGVPAEDLIAVSRNQILTEMSSSDATR